MIYRHREMGARALTLSGTELCVTPMDRTPEGFELKIYLPGFSCLQIEGIC